VRGPWLLVDIGNSRVKWAWAEGESWVSGLPFPSERSGLERELDRHWGGLAGPAAVQVSNVLGSEFANVLAAWVARRWGCPIHYARSLAEGYGVVNGYARPERLGVDRWVALVGLRQMSGLPACVADCGTALTFDVLDGTGRHRGGLIAPGLGLMRRALALETHGVPAVEGEARDFPGRDTAAGVSGGVLLAGAGLIEKALRNTEALLGSRPILVLTGGDAETLGRCLAVPYRPAPELVLRGLLTIAETEA
jgi:type III pantothenate kinase